MPQPSERLPVAASRGVRRSSYTLVTPANHYPSRLPNLRATQFVKLVTPRFAPARFGQYLLVIKAGGGTDAPVAPGFETFLYGLDGQATLTSPGVEHSLSAGAFAYLPPAAGFELDSTGGARVLWLKRRLEEWPGLGTLAPVTGHRDDAPFEDTDMPGFRRRELLDPADARLDFNMSLLQFDPGVGLPKVEVHDEEHGLYMTAGAGHYHLDEDILEVVRDDFIYMAPYCPQSFVATGSEPAEYLLYKDVYRDGF
jgi:(S)-ureidoglycine aminohydrolase